MQKMFDKVILVDDSDADNFLHRLIIEESGVARSVHDFLKGEDALEFLRKKESDPELPTLLLLDINMPTMSGWEFLEAYEDIKAPKDIVVVMLTTSLNPDDRERAEKIETVRAFINKPLDGDVLQDLQDQFLLAA